MSRECRSWTTPCDHRPVSGITGVHHHDFTIPDPQPPGAPVIIRTVLSLALVCTTTLAAQQSSFVGVWTVSYPGGAMMENGVMTPIMATGTLSIAVQADSLVGSLVMDPNPELGPRPEVRMTAVAGAGAATFVSRSEATLSTNGDIADGDRHQHLEACRDRDDSPQRDGGTVRWRGSKWPTSRRSR